MGSRDDERWSRLSAIAANRRLLEWGGLALVVIVAAVLRLWNLGTPHSLVFDETYYVKDSYTLLNLGYEAKWPEDPNPAFEAGDVDTYLDDAAFVVHPPLGKWLMALGLAAFGAESSIGWRISVALIGVLAVALLWAVTRLLLRSALLATIAGGLMAIDGLAITMSRIALLDNFLMFFTLLGFLFVLLDRGQSAGRLRQWMLRREQAGRPTDWGPALWARPWLVAAGLAFGLATAVKWNGLYFLAVFAVYTLVVDALARRRAGVTFWASGTVFKQAPVSFLLTVPIAAATYLTSWWGWFATDGGYYRRWAEEAGNAWTGALSWVPLGAQSWWHYQVTAYNFHVGLHTEHAWSSPAWQWLPLLRPTALYRLNDGGVESFITTLPNPLIWWGGVAAAVYLLVRLIRRRDWRAGLVLTGVAAGYLPWLLYPERTIFQFYSIAFEPYLIIALTMALGATMLRYPPGRAETGSGSEPGGGAQTGLGTEADVDAASHDHWMRQQGERIVLVFLVLAVLLGAYFYPLASGMALPEDFIRSHYWLPGWR